MLIFDNWLVEKSRKIQIYALKMQSHISTYHHLKIPEEKLVHPSTDCTCGQLSFMAKIT